MAKLSGGVAVIRVGASTETELKYMKDKMEDAAAVATGRPSKRASAGGGIALLKASRVAGCNRFENQKRTWTMITNLVI